MISPSVPEWDQRPGDYLDFRDAMRNTGLASEVAKIKVPHTGADIPERTAMAVRFRFAREREELGS